MRRLVPIALLAVVACGDDDTPPRALPRPAPAAAPAPSHDATPPDAVTTAGNDTEDALFDRFRPRSPSPRRIEITLRSTPPGAIAAVDGVVIGPTPAFWSGKMSGQPREFTFVLDGYALARYRFVPVKDGVVHATLPATKDGTTEDAGPR